MCRCQDHSFFGCHQSRLFRIISVLRKCFLSCVFRIFLTLFWKNDNGCRAILLLLILCNTLVSVTELFAKDRKYDDLLPYTWLAVERATGIIINNSGKSEDLVLMTAERQTYRHRNRDIIQTCYSIVYLTTSVLEEI